MTKQQDNQLFAHWVPFQRGLAINDQDGVININTDIGGAFYPAPAPFSTMEKLIFSVIQWMKVIPTWALRRMTKMFSVSCLAAARASVKPQLATVLSP